MGGGILNRDVFISALRAVLARAFQRKLADRGIHRSTLETA